MCSAQPWILGLSGTGDCFSKPDSCPSPDSHESQILGNVVDGNSPAVPAEGACGTQPPRHSLNPDPAQPRLLLQRFSPSFLSPFRKFRNKNPMLNAIPCVALRTCCRMYLHSPEQPRGGRRKQLQPCFPAPAHSGRCPQPCSVRKLGTRCPWNIFVHFYR